MLAREVMTSQVITVSPSDTVKHVAQVLDKASITAAPVVDDDGALVGIVSEADLLRSGVEHDPRGHLGPVAESQEPLATQIADVMSPHVLTVTDGTDAAEVAELLLESGVKSVPVVSGRIVIGIVSRRDLLGAMARDDERIRDEVELRLHEYMGGPPPWQVMVEDGVVSLSGRSEPEHLRVATILARTVAGVVHVEAVPVPAQRVEG